MGVVVVCRFHMGNFISSGSGVRSTKDPQIDFNFLVDLFDFSIRLRMVGGGEEKIIVEGFSKFFGKG